MADPRAAVPDEVLAAWRELGPGARVEPMAGGLIHGTYRVAGAGGPVVLQRMSPIFAPEVNLDVAAVTEHLAGKGRVTPRLLPTRAGRLWLEHGGAVYRAMTFVPGASFSRVQGPAQARAAGEILGRFHADLADLDHTFRNVRRVHDTAAHLAALEEALAAHPGHRLRPQVEALAEDILRAAQDLPALDGLPRRTGHGDPKLDNLRFAGPRAPERDRGLCMLDLDTCGRHLLAHELGDAWRSWANPAGEDRAQASFDLEIHAASWTGYCAVAPAPTAEERASLLHGLEWITLELAARFAADALAESYFGWDRARFPAAGEHNLLRARGQWSLHGACVASRRARARDLGLSL